jgi:putative tryptophan/tyrosine transport system substrate-binding protein
MRRRDLIKLLGGAAAAWPLAARAQQAVPVIGFLEGQARDGTDTAAGCLEALRDSGYVEGRNFRIEYRFADNQYDRLPGLAAELVRMKVAVIVATPTAAALAAKSATSTIPIVFMFGNDPIQSGMVSSLSRPGGNITGVSYMTNTLSAKQLQLVAEAMPQAERIGFLVNPGNPAAAADKADVETGARTLGRQIHVVEANKDADIESAFAGLSQSRVGALIVEADGYFRSRRELLVTLAARHAVPTIYVWREFPPAGGLMSYGDRRSESAHQAGLYVARILKGENPGDLPVQLATRIELVINLKTAKALGLELPTSLLVRADEIIE